MKSILDALKQKYENLSSMLLLFERLTGTEFNSVLLEIFKMQAAKVKPADLVRHFTLNRFVAPFNGNVLTYKTLELDFLQLAAAGHFTPVLLSPLSPLGTCSAVAEVDQHNVVGTLRGTEVVSDATNVLALKIASDFKKTQTRDVVKYATAHRHVRGQFFTNPAFTAHFGVFCLVSGGLDTGAYAFELEQLLAHVNVHFSALSSRFDKQNLTLQIYIRQENKFFVEQLTRMLAENGYHFDLVEDYRKGDYYPLVQFKINLKHNGQEINVVDGGSVDWTQKLIPNKKHRLFISGCGIELAHKMLEGLL